MGMIDWKKKAKEAGNIMGDTSGYKYPNLPKQALDAAQRGMKDFTERAEALSLRGSPNLSPEKTPNVSARDAFLRQEAGGDRLFSSHERGGSLSYEPGTNVNRLTQVKPTGMRNITPRSVMQKQPEQRGLSAAGQDYVNKRLAFQDEYNKKYNLTPESGFGPNVRDSRTMLGEQPIQGRPGMSLLRQGTMRGPTLDPQDKDYIAQNIRGMEGTYSNLSKDPFTMYGTKGEAATATYPSLRASGPER